MSPFSNYEKTIDWLYNLHLFGIKFGLKKIEKILEYLDNPERKLNIIHVAGTNGKGSVCMIAKSILESAGYRVGLNTSPHLSEFTERIQINNEYISQQKVVEYANLLETLREKVNTETELGYATYFEVVTAMALKYFVDNNVDYVVLEVGLGGKFDATNVVLPKISVITNIGLDHTEHLGNSLTSVAENKAGIIKPKVPVITANTDPEVLSVINQTCLERDCPLFHVGKEIRFKILSSTKDGLKINYRGLNFDCSGLQIPFIGNHQAENAALALGAIDILSCPEYEGFNITEEQIRTGILNSFWPGRLEIVQKKPLVIIDGAHNSSGARVLRQAIELFDYKKLNLVFGCSEEKDIPSILSELVPMANKIYITRSNNRRAAMPELILKAIEGYNLEKEVVIPVKKAVKLAITQANEDDLTVICGSLFVVGEARELWMNNSRVASIEKLPRIHY